MKTTSSTSEQSSKKDLERIDRLFLRFGALYGNVWRALYKSDAFLNFTKTEWMKSLMGFENKILDKAILVCLDHYQFPPTLPQFIDCCKSILKRETSIRPVEKDLKPVANPAVAKAHLRQLKQMLNIKTNAN